MFEEHMKREVRSANQVACLPTERIFVVHVLLELFNSTLEQLLSSPIVNSTSTDSTTAASASSCLVVQHY